MRRTEISTKFRRSGIDSELGDADALDACQSLGHVPIDIDSIGCDFLSARQCKFVEGPRGAGLFYARTTTAAALEPALIDRHSAS